jgi:hypothetical protein
MAGRVARIDLSCLFEFDCPILSGGHVERLKTASPSSSHPLSSIIHRSDPPFSHAVRRILRDPTSFQIPKRPKRHPYSLVFSSINSSPLPIATRSAQHPGILTPCGARCGRFERVVTDFCNHNGDETRRLRLVRGGWRSGFGPTDGAYLALTLGYTHPLAMTTRFSSEHP